MPLYEYECVDCEEVSEFLHGMDEKPTLACRECESTKLMRLMSASRSHIGHGRVEGLMRDRAKLNSEIKQDLAENHMVEGVSPVAASSLSQVHKEIKDSGSMVKDRMQETMERTAVKKKDERKDWMAKALPRAAKRRPEINKRKAEDAASKRRIVLTSK